MRSEPAGENVIDCSRRFAITVTVAWFSSMELQLLNECSGLKNNLLPLHLRPTLICSFSSDEPSRYRRSAFFICDCWLHTANSATLNLISAIYIDRYNIDWSARVSPWFFLPWSIFLQPAWAHLILQQFILFSITRLLSYIFFTPRSIFHLPWKS